MRSAPRALGPDRVLRAAAVAMRAALVEWRHTDRGRGYGPVAINHAIRSGAAVIFTAPERFKLATEVSVS
jgi:hypothetical protein